MTIPETFERDFLTLIICTLHFTGLIQAKHFMPVSMWDFEPVSSCEVLT